MGMNVIVHMNEFVKSVDATRAPEVLKLQLAPRFVNFGENQQGLYEIPKIPLWVMIQPSYSCLSPSQRCVCVFVCE